MLEFLVAGTGSHTDLFRGIGLDFFSGGRSGVGDFGEGGRFPGFCLGFCFAGRRRSGFVVAKLAEIELLDWVLTEDGGC